MNTIVVCSVSKPNKALLLDLDDPLAYAKRFRFLTYGLSSAETHVRVLDFKDVLDVQLLFEFLSNDDVSILLNDRMHMSVSSVLRLIYESPCPRPVRVITETDCDCGSLCGASARVNEQRPPKETIGDLFAAIGVAVTMDNAARNGRQYVAAKIIDDRATEELIFGSDCVATYVYPDGHESAPVPSGFADIEGQLAVWVRRAYRPPHMVQEPLEVKNG